LSLIANDGVDVAGEFLVDDEFDYGKFEHYWVHRWLKHNINDFHHWYKTKKFTRQGWIVVKKEKSTRSFDGEWKHSRMPTKLPNPEDVNLINFQFKDKMQSGWVNSATKQNKSTPTSACLMIF
jgi:DNA modification methylase